MSPRSEEARDRGDYEAAPPSAKEAAEFVEAAGAFLTAIEELLAVDPADSGSTA